MKLTNIDKYRQILLKINIKNNNNKIIMIKFKLKTIHLQ